jgi:hypothetical protein
VQDTEWYDGDVGNYVVYPGNYTLSAALSSAEGGVSVPFSIT